MHEYTVELRIYGKDLHPAGVTSDLGLEPSLVLMKGDKISQTKQVKESLWAYSGIAVGQEHKFSSLEENLVFLLERLWPNKDKIKTYQSKNKVVLWCGHFQDSFNGGPTLSASTLRLLGEFGVDLFIDTYFSKET